MNEVRKRHDEEKITSGQHFCGKCGSLLPSRGSDCVQCNSNSKEQEMKQKNVKIPAKGENNPVLPQSSFSFSVKGFPTLLVIGAILGFTTFAIIGMFSAPDVIYIEPDYGDGGYYDDLGLGLDGYYDGGYYDGGYYDDGYYYGGP